MPDISSLQIHRRHIEGQFADDPAIVETATQAGCISVDDPDQLPKSLRHHHNELPGLLFIHNPLGGGEPVPQFRPDSPAEDGTKYSFPAGAGSVISIAPSMQRRLDSDVSRNAQVLIVEGTKQNLFAATYAPDDVVVVGIQGCWGWSSDGMAVASLDDLCKGRQVIVAFDADISSNQKVYDAAESLSTTLATVGAKSVKYLKVPGSKKTGLDDFIARRPIDNRSEPLATMIANAIPFTKMRKPPRTSSALVTGGDTFDFISEELGEVVEGVLESIGDNGLVVKEHASLAIAGKIDGRNVRRISTLLRAAPSIVAVVEEKNDLTPGAATKLLYNIDLQIGPADSCSHYSITDIPDENLASVREWIAHAGTAGAFAALGRGGQGTYGQIRIAEAMRDLAKHSKVERRTTLLRTGWYEEDKTAYWVDSGGAHGPEGKITSIRARLEGSVSSLEIPDYLNNFTRDEVIASARAVLGVCDFLYDPTPWITGIAGTIWALAGAHPDAVLYFVGGAGSGKSSITGALASALGPRWGTGADPMASVEGTEAYLSDMTKQIHNCPLILDDARDRSSLRSQESQDSALDSIIRVGYSGGGAARGKKVQGKSKDSWRQSATSSNRPFVIIAGETLPDSAPQSTIERCLVVEIKASTSLKSAKDTTDGRSGLEHLIEVSRSGALRPMLSHFLYRGARQLTDLLREEGDGGIERLDDIREDLENGRTSIAEDVIAKHWPKGVSASQRVLQVLSTFVAGASLLAEYLNLSGLMDEDDVKMMEDEWHKKIIVAAASHSSINLTKGGEAELIIAKVKDAILSTRYCLGVADAGQTCVGSETNPSVGGERVRAVALIPSVVGEIIGNRHNLDRRLSSVLIPGGDGRLTRNAHVNGTSARCLVIRGDVWYDVNEDQGDNENEQ